MAEGLSLPLKLVPYEREGLLAKLPAVDQQGWPWDTETTAGMYDPALKWPKITIVTPSFNQGKYIEETIRGVLLQNYPNLEYIIMDGGSTDETKEIIEKYSPWISYWQSKKDNGQGQAINLGFSLSSGDIHGWINSDDFYMENALFKVAKAFANKQTTLIYGDGLHLNEERKTVIYEKANLVADRYLFLGGVILQHSCFWRSAIHLPILEVLHCAVDSELWFRLIPKQKIKHVNYPLAVSRAQPDAKTVSQKFVKMWEEDNALIEKIHEFDKTWFFKYVKSKFYSLEARYVQRFYKYFNVVPVQHFIEKIKKYRFN